ncbi:hypothetical protein K3758_05995 [Sulfitobacter sp. W002]|nr:hypothetical protein [Sulfitobacter sp. W002]UWR31071.1 hypothetical protein K3758_05995 [Sulfitobacter sp. W002]
MGHGHPPAHIRDQIKAVLADRFDPHHGTQATKNAQQCCAETKVIGH